MTQPLWCLLAFAGWGMLLLYLIGVHRVTAVMTGKKKPNEFPGGVQHGGDRYWRINRAHMNVVENLPWFAVIVIVGTIIGVASSAWNWLPVVVVCARVVQSLIHISSGRNLAVNFRFTAFLVQHAAMIGMVIEILRHAASRTG
jgi:uncharacterized MAPEG superfamily protein